MNLLRKASEASVADIILFKPQRELSAQANLKAFVALCRNSLTIFGQSLEFDVHTWDVSGYIKLKSKNTAVRLVFSSWATANQRAPKPMPEPFLSFAKAFFRYQHGLNPTKAVGPRLAALRAVCEALDESGTHDPSAAHAGVFNRAAQLVAEHFSHSTGYTVGTQLELLAKFMDDNRLGSIPVQWKNILARPTASPGRVGKEFDEIRHAKLPSAFALDALARAFREASEPPDVVVTSVAAILCSAPDRVNEVLSLRVDCEVKKEQTGRPTAFGLRYWPSKGAEPMVKWVVPSMADVVQEALKRLRLHTIEARSVAAWYEANPTAMYLPPHLEHFRGRTDLSLKEMMDMLFVEPKEGGSSWCKRNKVAVKKQGRKSIVAFADVERVVVSELPRNFPLLDEETGLRYSQALCIVRRNSLHATRGVYWGLIDAVDHGTISTGLGNRSAHGFRSVFERMGMFEADGTPIAIRSHQFRHYLNTLAQAGGMSELDIAKWSGRADIRQNSAYNHVSDRDIQARIADLKGENSESFGHLVAQTRVSLLPRARFAELKIPSAHTTDFGFCVHDFAMTPCQLHLDCANCNEQVCIKGDEFGEANARAKCRETKALLEEAQAADADGAYGASRWVQHQQLTLERLTQLVGILDDPSVPRGAVIRLAHIKPASRLQQAAEARRALPNLLADVPQLAWQVEDQGPSA
jgi:hypothetical protein